MVFDLALSSVGNRVCDPFPLVAVLEPLLQELNILLPRPLAFLETGVQCANPPLSTLLALSKHVVLLAFLLCHQLVQLGSDMLPSNNMVAFHDLHEEGILEWRPLDLRALLLLDEEPSVLALLGVLVGKIGGDCLPVFNGEILRILVGSVHGPDNQVHQHLCLVASPLALAGDLHGSEGLADLSGLKVCDFLFAIK